MRKQAVTIPPTLFIGLGEKNPSICCWPDSIKTSAVKKKRPAQLILLDKSMVPGFRSPTWHLHHFVYWSWATVTSKTRTADRHCTSLRFEAMLLSKMFSYFTFFNLSTKTNNFSVLYLLIVFWLTKFFMEKCKMPSNGYGRSIYNKSRRNCVLVKTEHPYNLSAKSNNETGSEECPVLFFSSLLFTYP